MATKREIHEFAIKWFEKYRGEKTTEHEAAAGFSEECFSLGFEMDCGHSFENAFQDYESLDKRIERVDDVDLLGSAIFSKWRDITYRADHETLLSPENRPWFILAFARLATLTSEDGTSPFMFQGQAQKIQIVSNNIGFGLFPEPDEEVEQRLTVAADGRVWFSGYNYGQGDGRYERGRTKNFSIGRDAAARILNAVGAYFSKEYRTEFATDIGTWEMTVANTDGKPYRFEGSLCCDFDVGGVDLSDLIRDTLDMPDLILFNGNCKPDRVDRIVLNYHRVTKIRPRVPVSDTIEYCTWNYSEQMIIDRKTETLEYIQRVGSGCVISHQYSVPGGVSDLLDELDADSLFEHIAGNGLDAVTDSNEIKNYEITVGFYKRAPLVVCGTYDRDGLPEDWPELAERISDFMRFYGLGEAFNPSVYGKARRKTGDCIFCSVEFGDGGKSYYYLTEDDTLSAGDLVVVPVGKDDGTAVVKIVDIEYFPADKVPFPLDKVKSILRKCTEDDLKTQEP